ncbi:LysR family transcriptional regulator [Clostridium magnum]|uniref:HTH-type transcriptional regulator GltR n=1 Tax=Clostridium magnum DSM 2767 TaxID=1121326 RepID=A0A162RZK8_9CLOT|nr:LysR family transcriptional regulator [Clostridium magnum]KZL90591.1 HTH-type transcriptional regulator GltR [Clostridium magnum DSM 2767]SHI05529.1 transcriptional regulator, LysR family [Clostridium magnum DSM 2767]
MEIRHLQTFISIVELGGFTKAADHLGYAQSTITAHIQILEDEIGDALFDRLGKKILLTNVGKELVPYARQMLQLYKEIKNITAEQKGVSGDIIIGAGESLSVYRLGKILKEYKRSFPKVNIILRNSICSDLRSRLHSGELDIIFTIEPKINDRDLIVRNLKDESMVIISESDESLEGLSTNCENQISKENIIFSERGCSFRISFEKYLKEKKIKYLNPLEFSSIEAIKKCVINGLGISVLPYYAVKNEINNGSLKMLELKEPFDKYLTQLVYHKNKRISLAMSKLIEITLKNSTRWE